MYHDTMSGGDWRWGVTATGRVPTADANKPASAPDTALSRGIFRKPDHRRIIAMSSYLIASGNLLDATGAPIKPNTSVFVVGNKIEFRSEEHTSELQSLMRISYAVFCLKKKNKYNYEAVPYTCLAHLHQHHALPIKISRPHH